MAEVKWLSDGQDAARRELHGAVLSVAVKYELTLAETLGVLALLQAVIGTDFAMMLQAAMQQQAQQGIVIPMPGRVPPNRLNGGLTT